MVIKKKKKIGSKNFSLQTRTPKTDRACFYQNETAWGWGVIIRNSMGPLDKLEWNVLCGQPGETKWWAGP